jgi:Lysyl oxidase
MKCSRPGLRCSAVAVSGLTLAATTLAGPAAAAARAGTAGHAASTGPVIKVVAAQNKITVGSFRGRVFLDPGIYVASLKSALVFHVQRHSYTTPVRISQIIHLPDGSTRQRSLPANVLRGFDGLRDFLRMRITDPQGKLVFSKRTFFCPNGFDPQRENPDSSPNSPYPTQCSAFDPFPLGSVWGIAKGWAVDQFQGFGNSFRLALGTYQVTVNITARYLRLFHISAKDSKATVTLTVVKGQGCCGQHRGRPVTHGSLPSVPAVPLLQNPPRSALPDLVPLPSWGIFTHHIRATKTRPASDQLDFGATVWVGGTSPLDVQGFRSHGALHMKAYQYFHRNGRIIGRARAGIMGFDNRHGHLHWHFEQFARYRLLNSARTMPIRSHKQGFCIAPTDPVDLLLRNAAWQPFFGFGGGFGFDCGSPSALWVREMMPIGWGDTYEQSVAGQSFDITSLPNGTYYIQVIANPKKALHESNLSNDTSLRRIILGGTPAHRTVRVPAWHGIDPEG